MRRLAMVVLAACSGPSPDTPAKPLHEMPPARPTVVRAGHAAAIEIVAATDDGKAAVTQDALGGTRLWPALDGTAEPIVVHAAGARELALGRDDGGFVIAGVDPAGILELIRIAPNGAVRGRVQLGAETTVEQIAMTPAGVLALRADQTLELYGADGRERARLVPPNGARIVSVIARDGHAVALIAEPALHARAIELAPVRWGTQGGAIAIPASRPVLAPDGQHLAMHVDGKGVAIIDVATGKQSAPICAGAEQANEQRGTLSDMVRQDALARTAPLGFLDAHTIVCFSLGQLTAWSLDGKPRPTDRPVETPEMAAIANGLTITAERESLGLTTNGSTQYLGYGISNASMVRTGPLGVTVGIGPQPLLLDRALRARTRFDLPTDPREIEDVMPLDDRHALVVYGDPNDRSVHPIAMVDTAARKPKALPFEPTSYELRYEAATHLLALVEKHGLSVVALDPITMVFGPRIHLSAPAHDADSSEPAIYLTDPALARGVAVVVVRKGRDGRAIVDEYEADGLHGSFAQASRTYEVFGSAAAVDRAGRTYIADGDAVNVFIGGELGRAIRVATLPGHTMVRPSPDATRLLLLGDNRMQMVEVTGHVQWMIAAPTAVDAGWIGDEPFARFSAGLAKLDPATGALLDRVCGWRFGLSPNPFDTVGDSQSVCDEE